jgi:predicted alpha/beta hydrolase family esterase
MKKVYLIHGWGGSPSSEGWFGWLIRECEKRNIEIKIPEMPNTNEPKIEEWLELLESMEEINEETYFIGHSIGAQAILRFLEKLPEEKKIGGAAFIAGWFNLKESAYGSSEEKIIAKPWIEIPIDYNKIKLHTNNFFAIFSDDDPCVPVSDAELFRQRLNAQIIIKHAEEHFNETQEIPELLELLK